MIPFLVHDDAWQPHRFCYDFANNLGVYWSMITGDCEHVIAYFVIGAFITFVSVTTYKKWSSQMQNLRGLLFFYGLFIMTCASTHLTGLIVQFFPMYKLDSVVRLISGTVSLGTAVATLLQRKLLWSILTGKPLEHDDDE